MLDMSDNFVLWPFALLKPEAERNEFDRDFIDFMSAAFAEGFRPRHQSCTAVEAESLSGRGVFLVYRGRGNGWEPWLREGKQDVRLGPIYALPLGESACVCVRPPFRAVAHLALEWLRGRALESLLADFVFVGGYPSGIELRSDVVVRPLVIG